MPLPNKSKSEKDKEFIQRCVGDSVMNKEFPNQKKRIAVCYSLLKKSKQRIHADINWDNHKVNGVTII